MTLSKSEITSKEINAMLLFLKILLGLIGILLVYLSGNWLFKPDHIMAQHDIQASSNTGKNYLRGDIGGILISGAIFIGMFLYNGGEIWMFGAIILLTSVILGRILSLIMDGTSTRGIQAIVVELIIIILILAINYLG